MYMPWIRLETATGMIVDNSGEAEEWSTTENRLRTKQPPARFVGQAGWIKMGVSNKVRGIKHLKFNNLRNESWPWSDHEVTINIEKQSLRDEVYFHTELAVDGRHLPLRAQKHK